MTDQPTDEVVQAVRAIADANHGSVLPEQLIQAARNRRHPLHEEFEWDDAVAGHEYRLEQARRLIRTIKVEMVVSGLTFRAPAFLRPAGDKSGVYVSPARLATDEDIARATVVVEFRRAAQALQRARTVALQLGMAGEVDDLLSGVTSVMTRASEQPGERG